MVKFRRMFLKRVVLIPVLILALAVSLPYLRGPLYRFPAQTSFAGSKFLNPYADLRDAWQRANLHAHGRAWNGLTNGRQSNEQIVRAYTSFGYTVAGVSNYQRIAAFGDVPTLPLYEHGYNLGKRHQLAVGARKVAWFDFPLWQSLSHKQFVIDRVANTAELVAIAHPSSREAYSLEDLRQLTGYQLLEVVNGPFLFEGPWDAALSAGRAVWALGNDDTHDLTDPRRTGMAWTMINAATPSTGDIIDALRAGRAYAVSRTNDTASAIETMVGNVTFNSGTLAVSCVGEPSTFVFVGQNGAIRKTVKHAMSAAYTFGGDDTYIRTVIQSPRTAMYLNPVLRYDGGRLPAPAATVDLGRTWLLRGTVALAGAALLLIYRDRRRPAVASPPLAVLTPANRKTA
jgi:hypothetical protein